MKLRLLAIAGTVLALSIGFGTAASATTINVRPYALSVIGIGSTAPGDPASKLCLVLADNPTTYGGNINGAPAAGHAGELNVSFKEQDLTTTVATCVPTSIAVTTNDPANIAIQAAAPKHGGTLQISTAASVQPGISATSTTTVDVTYEAGQSIKLPSGAVLVSGTLANPAGDTVRMVLKPTLVATKALLDTAACSDKQYFIDTNVPDGSKSNGPWATEVGSTRDVAFTGGSRTSNVVTLTGVANTAGFTVGNPIVVDAGTASFDGSFTVSSVGATTLTYAQTAANSASAGTGTVGDVYALGDAGTYVASIRGCAEQNVSIAGKPVTTKISVTGAGNNSVKFVKSATINPTVWDTTRGKSCSAVKTAGSFGTVLQSSRELACMGDYGVPIPLALDVRGWVANTPGQADPFGLLHPAPPVTILTGSFT